MPNKPKLNYAAESGTIHPKDVFQTPFYAVEPLIPFIPKNWVIWESAKGKGYLSGYLESQGYTVLGTDLNTGTDYFNYEPVIYDAQITNPPFSTKYQWFARACVLGKPFALLMPIDVIGAKSGQRLMREYNIEVMLLDGRVDFGTPNKGFEGSSSLFATAWFTMGLSLGTPLYYGTMRKTAVDQNGQKLVLDN